MASWLVRSTPERALRVRTLAGNIVLCSWARHFTLTVPLSAQVYNSLSSRRDLVRELFCFGCEAVNASGEAVRRLVKSRVIGFCELCVHQCTRISDWLRALKRQSNVNQYPSFIPRDKRLCLCTDLPNGECGVKHKENFGFTKYLRIIFAL